jgi:hypothetical protein
MEISTIGESTVNTGKNILFTNTTICGSASILHDNGSGLVMLRGLTNQCYARFRVFFSGNVAVPSDETVDSIQMAICINGEPIEYGTMYSTPGATADYNSICSSVIVKVPQGCCEQVSIQNVGTVAASVQNANLIVERIA